MRAVFLAKLSYMLIEGALRASLASGSLIKVRPIAPWAAEKRAFLMCLPLQQAILDGREEEDEKDRKRWAALEAGMSAFVEGGLVTRELMKPLEPKKFENWVFKQRRPRPGLRIFGSFAKPDVFVGTHVKDRNGLGGKNSQEYEHERLVSEQIWKDAGLPLLADGRPNCFTDPDYRYEAYITDNAREEVRIS